MPFERPHNKDSGKLGVDIATLCRDTTIRGLMGYTGVHRDLKGTSRDSMGIIGDY